MTILQRCVLAACAAFAAGCATVPTEESFRAISEEIQERTGMSVQWNSVTADEDEVSRIVYKLFEDGISVEEAVQVALLNNPRLQATYSEYGIAVGQLVEAGMFKNPLFSGTVRFEQSHLQIWDFEIVQDFLSLLLIPLRKAVAEAELEQAKMKVMADVIDIAMETKRAFHHYQADEQLLHLWESELLAKEASFEMAVKLREAGNITAAALSMEQSRYEHAKLDIAAAQLDARASREHMNRHMGLWGPSLDWTTSNRLGDIPLDTVDVAGIEREALENSLDLAMGYLDVELSARKLGIRNVRAIFPELEIGAAFESANSEEIGLRSRGPGLELAESRGSRVWEVGPAFTLPIPLFNQGQATRATGRAQIRQRWEEYTALSVELRSAARNAAYRLLETRAAALYERDVILPLMQHLMEQAELEYNGMFIGVFDLLDVKSQQIDAARQYVSTSLEYWLAHADVQQILLGRMVLRAPEDRPDLIGADIRLAEHGTEED